MTEFWSFPRQRVLRGNILVDGEVAASCDVHLVSRTGAMLRVGRNATLPSAFKLSVPNEGSVLCSVVRRGSMEVVVRFDRP
jgi:hypothetical protein